MKKLILSSVLIAFLSGTFLAQKRSFEVATIRPNRPSDPATYTRWSTGRFSATNITVRGLVEFAYGIDNIIGGPAWIDTDKLDIEGKPNGPAVREDMPILVQSLLEDRLQLKTHREMREQPVYNLIVVKGGPKPSADQSIKHGTWGSTGSKAGQTLSGSLSISELIYSLRDSAGRPIIDKTNLKGFFDIDLQYNNDPSSENAFGQTLVTAIQKVGLKFEAAKAPVEFVVIDSIQKPSEN